MDIFDKAIPDKDLAAKVRQLAIDMSYAGILTDSALRSLLTTMRPPSLLLDKQK